MLVSNVSVELVQKHYTDGVSVNIVVWLRCGTFVSQRNQAIIEYQTPNERHIAVLAALLPFIPCRRSMILCIVDTVMYGMTG